MTEPPAEYYVSKAPKPLRGIDYLRKRIQNWFATLTAEGRSYSIGMALLGDGRILIGSRDENAGRYEFKIQHNASRGEVPASDDDHTGAKRGDQ